MGELPCDHVRWAACGKADNQTHRLCRVRLRPSEVRHGRESGSARCQMQKLPSLGKFHGVSLNRLREGFRDALSLPVRTKVVPARLILRAIFDTVHRCPRWRKDEESGQSTGFTNQQFSDSWAVGLW